jgi:hypothetical protein
VVDSFPFLSSFFLAVFFSCASCKITPLHHPLPLIAIARERERLDFARISTISFQARLLPTSAQFSASRLHFSRSTKEIENGSQMNDFALSTRRELESDGLKLPPFASFDSREQLARLKRVYASTARFSLVPLPKSSDRVSRTSPFFLSSHLSSLLEHSAHDYSNRFPTYIPTYRLSPLGLNLSRRFFTQLHLSFLVSTFFLKMSAPPHDGWPKVGDIFPHWSDLLLATQLAALRSGYTGIGKHWHPQRPTEVHMRCIVKQNGNRVGECNHRLIRATPLDLTDLSGKWVVDLVRDDNLSVGRHSRHTGAIGTSKEFPVSALKC